MKVLGKDPARLIGSVLWDEFPDVPNEAAVRRVVAERVAIADELYDAPLGEWVENHMYPSHDGGLVTFQKYITERKHVEEALLRSEERFRSLVEGVRDYATFALDPVGHVISWNAGAEHIKGYRSEEIIGRHFSCFYSPEDLAVGKPEMELRVAAAEGRFEDEGWRIRKDGSRFWANVVLTTLRSPQGELVGFSKVTRDLTERKRSEEALHEARAALAHVTRVMTMGELIASIAHEVNQPLGAIVTNGQACLRLLVRESPDLHKSREVIERVISDAMRASEVITRIRALLKKNDAEKALLYLNEIIQEVIALTSTELIKSEIHLQTALAAGLPPVLGDRVQLQQVILNLILNAKEAMSGVGWKTRELLITSLAGNSGEAVVAVRDSGTGLDPRDCDCIFDAFFTTPLKQKGWGWGFQSVAQLSKLTAEDFGPHRMKVMAPSCSLPFQPARGTDEGRKGSGDRR